MIINKDLKKFEDVTREEIEELKQDPKKEIAIITARGAIRYVAGQFKVILENGKRETVFDHFVMWNGNSWGALSNEAAKVFDPEKFAQRMERKAEVAAEQKARREALKAERAAQPKLSFNEKFGGEWSEGYMGASAWDGNNSRPNGRYLSDAELAASIREDLRDYITELKRSQIFVSKESYSMGRSIDVKLKLNASDYAVDPSDSRLHASYNNKLNVNHYHLDRYEEEEILKPEAVKLLKKVRQIIQSYDYDHSNSMVDYFDKNFYYDIIIEWVDIEKAA